MYSKSELPSAENLRNGWQLSTFRRELAGLGAPRNLTADLERLGYLSMAELGSEDGVAVLNESAPAWEGQLPELVDAAEDDPPPLAVKDEGLKDKSLPQPQVGRICWATKQLPLCAL
jgi:hypothetical protein